MLHKLWQQPQFFKDYLRRLEKIRAHLPGEKSAAVLRLSGSERVGEYAIYDIDPGKLLFTSHTDISAEAIAEIMAKDYKVQMEMSADSHILAMTSVADTDEGFDKLKAAIDGLNVSLRHSGHDRACPGLDRGESPPFFIPEIVIPPRQAINLPSIEVPWEAAIGQVSAQLIATYPPGIALVAPGERIPQGLPHQQETIRVIKF